MLMFQIPILLLAVHWFADFVCQTDWQAQNKSKNWHALTNHVVAYTWICAWPMVFFLPSGRAFASFYALTFVTHFLTDAVTSRINTRLWQAKQVHYFFVSVGFDQLIHFTTLALTWNYLKG